MRANIYSLEPLQSDIRDAVHDGIGLVAAHLGEPVVSRDLTVRVPVSDAGYVTPGRVGLRRLDPLVELHVMAVPMIETDDQIGVAQYGRGVSFVSTTSNTAPYIRTIAAHESAHALGFITPVATHTIPGNDAHCATAECLMHPSVLTDTDEQVTIRRQSFRDRLLGREPTVFRTTILRMVNGQYDFCFDCKLDMRDQGQKRLSQLRFHRLSSRDGL